MTKGKNRIPKRSPSEAVVVETKPDQGLCNEHLQAKLYWQKGMLCDSLCHTTASMMRFLFSILSQILFYWGGFARTEGGYEGMKR